MEFNNQYLSYEEYKSLGGTLGEMPFNILELKARQIINERTQNRLKDVKKIPQEVKICVYDLIQIINKYNNSNNSTSSNISSENIDGYSVTYKSGTELTDEQKKQFNERIRYCMSFQRSVLNHQMNIIKKEVTIDEFREALTWFQVFSKRTLHSLENIPGSCL